jgi:adenylosuccinate synthase
VGGQTTKLHLLPSGVLYPGKRVIIGAGCLVDPTVLLEEIQGLKDRGIEINLGLSGRAHVILESHKLLDGAVSDSQGKLAAGSTRRGIAPVASDKAARNGVRIVDLLDHEVLQDKLEVLIPQHQKLLNEVYGLDINLNIEDSFEQLKSLGEKLSQYIGDTELELYQAQHAGKTILLEGAQGLALDPDYGVYPHTTSTNNVAGYGYVGSGVVPDEKPRVIGVTKAYLSRVGQSPLPTELFDQEAEDLRIKGHEFGTTTGRARRVGWLDLVHLKQAVQAHGITELAITKFDILSGMDGVPVCIAYDIDGVQTDVLPMKLSDYRKAKPVYKNLAGWDDLPEVINSDADLPIEVMDFIKFVEDFVGCDVSIVSHGPDREQTMFRSGFEQKVKLGVS